MKLCILAALAGLLVAGCGGVVCENPASDDATTRIDERLIGFWRVDWKASALGTDTSTHDHVLFVVGRAQGEAAGLQAVLVSIDDEQRVKVQQEEARATKVGERGFVSVRMPKESAADDEAGKVRWAVLRYEMPDDGTLRILALDEVAAAAEVRAGKVAGSVKERKAEDGKAELDVTLSISTALLRTWLEQRGDAALRRDRFLVLKRLAID